MAFSTGGTINNQSTNASGGATDNFAQRQRGKAREVSFPAIRNLQPATPLALDDDSAAPRAQFDLSNMAAGRIHLFGDQGQADSQGDTSQTHAPNTPHRFAMISRTPDRLSGAGQDSRRDVPDTARCRGR